MAVLVIPDEGKQISDPKEIREYLDKQGVWFDQWQASKSFSKDADQETILSAYAHVLDPFMKENGYTVADVINVTPETPNLEAIRQKFLHEHIHTEDEVRFFVDGQGYFWFNMGEGKPIFYVLCEAGDLISVPEGTKHWFDMGDKAFVKAIRMFIDQSGWVPHYTESGMDEKYVGKYPEESKQ